MTAMPSQQIRDYARIERAIHFLGQATDEKPSLAAIAAEIGLSPFHFHRLFSRWAGVSPKRYLAYLSLAHARARLRQSQSVLATALDTGLSGPSRVHDLFVAFEAVTPGEYARRGDGLEVRFGFHPTPFGRALFLTSPRGLVGLSFVTERGDDFAFKEQIARWPKARLTLDRRASAEIAGRVFARGPRPDRGASFNARGDSPARAGEPLHALVSGTNFQIKVWEALLRTPEGALVSYNQIGAMIGCRRGSRAVGNALAANPLAYLIPCHRVIRASGAFNDYRWGASRRQAIVAWEGAQSARPSTSRIE